MKIIISESQKILLIKKHLSEQSVDLPGDESFSVGGFLKKAFERAKEIHHLIMFKVQEHLVKLNYLETLTGFKKTIYHY
jgi:hypothetical protein